MSGDEILYGKQGGIATLTLNRPDKMNALSVNMIGQWVEALEECRRDSEVKAVVLTGAGKAFSSGGDVATMGIKDQSPLDSKNFLWKHMHRVAFAFEDLDKPVIAAVNGVAVGAGLDMALMCDLRFAADMARFSEGYVRVGLVPGDGGAYFLPRLVGTAKALELLWTGDFIDAKEAMRIGMVNRVYPADKLLDETYTFVERLVSGPEVAIRMIKRSVYQSLKTDLRTALDLISSHFAVAQFTGDHQEGVKAMQERRKPRFTTQDI